MKVIHVTASYKPAYIYGGPIQSVGKLCEALAADHKHPIHLEVFTTTANGAAELAVETQQPQVVDGVQVTYFKRWTKDHSHFSPGLLLRLRKVLKQAQQNDEQLIIHIHAWWNLVSILGCLIAKWYNFHVVLSPRGMLTHYSQHNRHSFAKRFIHSIMGRRLLSYCHIHATSLQEKADILQIIRHKPITVIPNLINLAPATHQPQPISTGSTLNLIFLSRIEEKKGLDLLFDALARLNFSWYLTIVGSGSANYVKNLKDRANDLKIDDQIKWYGQVNDQDKFELMATHDVLVLTSYNENFANVVLESLSVGTAVLISDQVGLADYVEDKDLGWICRLTVHDIINKLISSNDQNKREKIRLTAPDLVRQDFNAELLARRYLEMYKEAMRCEVDQTGIVGDYNNE
ncbi:XrtY-associated glycosyltransferase XYAG1 [Pedobacter sp. GR22-10]|uniref:XrtY-associated glycosyltransferase XYAG1 n=1 Tax=Pedobacter sp. GR22-10 TaxID=2994472 RepID=UPI00224843C5|nr:glycosyltransferase [Pedobacter sp. GR22-10]MCX2431369.1 glycosyltransferase [Pedobacter sp. GR22-10]